MFEKIRYEIDGGIDPARLAEGYGWIKKSADHGFAPAREAQKLFIGKVTLLNNAVQPTGVETNRTSSATGSRR